MKENTIIVTAAENATMNSERTSNFNGTVN